MKKYRVLAITMATMMSLNPTALAFAADTPLSVSGQDNLKFEQVVDMNHVASEELTDSEELAELKEEAVSEGKEAWPEEAVEAEEEAGPEGVVEAEKEAGPEELADPEEAEEVKEDVAPEDQEEVAPEEEAGPEEEVDPGVPEEREEKAALGEEEASRAYAVEVNFKGAAAECVMHNICYDGLFQIPENASSQPDEGYEFTGYYCVETGALYQVGDSVDLDEITPSKDAFGEEIYTITLDARFKKIQKESPEMTYTEQNRYQVSVSIVSPADYDNTISAITANAEDESAVVGTLMAPRTLTRGVYAKYQLEGFRSLKTGREFTLGQEIKVSDLAAPVAGDIITREISDTEGYKITPYTVEDVLVPVFSFYGKTGTYLENTVDCEIAYYHRDGYVNKEDKDDALVYDDTETVKVAMSESEDGIVLTGPEEVPGYIFKGYGPLGDTETIYEDNVMPLEDCVEWKDGQLRFSVMAYYEVDPDYESEDPEVTPDKPAVDPDEPSVPVTPVTPVNPGKNLLQGIILLHKAVTVTLVKTVKYVVKSILGGIFF